jgi:hypothetical protein
MSKSSPSPSLSREAPTGEDGGGPARALHALGRLLAGTNDLRVFWAGWTAQGVIVLVINLFDVQARLRDAAMSNLLEPVWRPFTDEFSSGIVVILAFPALYRMAVAFPPGRMRIERFLGLHALGALVFTGVHLAGFVALRFVVYGLFGELYRFGGAGQAAYELPRDLITYAMTAGGVWGVAMVLPPAAEIQARPARATFDIRDNSRIVRVPADEIVAVRSAGNYVEFLLLDGRRPLMRATLAEMAGQLAPHGLIRTHRSWLVNRSRIAQVDPAGSGDFKLSLTGGIQAPLSRRFRGAVDL